MKNRVRVLVADARWEFVSGGWVASDEACPVFSELIQNIQTGHDFLEREFGLAAPKIVWHMDSFGHSATTARMFEEMGFEAFIFARMNETQKRSFKSDKTMQFVWAPAYESEQGKRYSGG